MDTQVREVISSVGTSSYEIKEDDSKSKLIKSLIPRKMSKRTELFPHQYQGTISPETEGVEEVPIRLEGLYRETIREWWLGKVVNVHHGEGYFEAQLRDLKGIEIIAEFNIGPEYEHLLSGVEHLFPGASFIFYVATKHGRGAPEIVSRLEFTTPHIWQEEDNNRVKELYRELFPNDPPL